MAKSKKIVKTIEKPLAMKFYDTQAEIIKELKLKLYIDGTTMHPKLLYQKPDGTYKYRINYVHEDVIVNSKAVSVKIVDNKFVIQSKPS